MNTYAYAVRHKNGWGTGFGPRPTHCHECAAALPARDEATCAAGYATGKAEPISSHVDAPELKAGETLERSPAICYACCGKHDKAYMLEHGKITLYLSRADDGWYVGNWPATLRFPVSHMKQGAHNIARSRYDAWFTGPDGKQWHAVNIGDNQIARCKRLKAK